MRFFREMRLMVYSIGGCMRTLFWGMILLLIIIWCFAIFFVQFATEFRDNNEFELESETLKQYFGDLFSGFETLFQSITGGCDYAVPEQSLGDIHFILQVVFLLYIALMNFAVLNVLIGIFVENAKNAADYDHDRVVREMLSSEKFLMLEVRNLFFQSGGTGHVTLENLKEQLNDERLRNFFKVLDLDVNEAEGLFKLMDINSNNSINAEEFVTGCMRLRGGAKRLDLASLLFENKRLSQSISSSMWAFEQSLRQVINIQLEIKDVAIASLDSKVHCNSHPVLAKQLQLPCTNSSALRKYPTNSSMQCGSSEIRSEKVGFNDTQPSFLGDASFVVGDRVVGLYGKEFRHQDRWFSAIIAEVREDGTYLLDWIDGDLRDRIKRAEDLRLVYRTLPENREQSESDTLVSV